MGRIASVLIKRAIFLAISLVIVVILTALIIGATGYDEQVWRAIIHEQVRAYQMSLMQKGGGINIREAVEKYKKELEHIYGLDKPWYERVLPLALRTLVLDLGDVMTRECAGIAGLVWPARVSDVILAVLPRTIIMITIAELICMSIAVPLAPLLAYKRGTLIDKFFVSYAALFNAVPVWWLAMIFIFFTGYQLHIAPQNYRGVMTVLARFWEDPLRNFVSLLYYAYIPIIVVVISFLGIWIYSIRAVTLRVVAEDFVMAARAKGLPDKIITRRYILRVVAGPIATYIILGLAGSIGGFIITESVFDWPGMGTLYYVAITVSDIPTLFGLVYITTLVYVIARFILEVLQVILDPRVRY